MPSFSWSAFSCRAAFTFRRRVTQPLARLEQRVAGYITASPPRRRASRIAGAVLFGCMSVVLMGTSQCHSCNDSLIAHGVSPFMEAILDIFSDYSEDAVPAPVRAYNTSPKPRFTGSDGSQTGTASFLGNFTAITEPSQTYFMMLRNTDCSLVQFVGSSSLNGSANVATYTTNYERTLHQLASLTTTPDVYAKGCVSSSPSISSRIAVALSKKANGTLVFANVATDGLYILSLSPDLSTIKFNAVGGLPYAFALATADVNGDGNGDLVVVNGYGTASPNISVLLGNGDGTFQSPVTYNIAGSQYAVAATIEDVNGDGKPDIVAVSDDQHISVLLGNGDGTFQSAMSFAAPALPGYTSSASTPILGLIAGDMNGDGKMDIVCSNGLVLLGKGDGTFTAVATPAFPYTSATPSGFGPGLAAGDINNDGKLDIVLDTGTTIATYLGHGDGSFSAGSSYASLNNSGYVTVTDLDGDGNLDIYSGLANGGMFSGDDSLNAAAYVLMGNGDGSFVGAPQVSGTYNGTNLGDVNGDGVPDLITDALGQSSNPSPTFTVQLGNGKGAFTAISTITAPASFVATTSALTSPVTITNANTVGPTSYAVADINGDGKADLVFVDNGLTAINPGNNQPFTYPSPIYFVALSNGDGTFKAPVPYNFPQIAPASGYDVATTAANVQIADINHDGKPDLIFTYNEQAGGPGTVPFSQGFAIVMGKGDGTFATTPFLTTTYSSTNPPTNSFVPQILSTTDLNGDGKPDLIVNSPGTVIINFQLQTLLQSYVGNGDGTFKAPTTITLGANAYGVPALADFNKDGKLDLAILAETASGQAELLVSTGNGDGTFGAPTISNLTGGDSIRSAALVAADFDGDGKSDLALLDANDFSGIFYGKGDGSFTSVPGSGYVVPKDLINITATNGGSAVAVDLNKDGKPDILAGSTLLINLYGNAPVVTTPTSTTLTASASTITVGSSITFTATVTPSAGGPPTGTVTFHDGSTILGTGAVNASGVATYTTTGLSAGAQSFTASYPGDSNFSLSTSPAVSVTVNPATVATSTALSASSTNAVSGTSITFTATVTPASGSTTPSGTVTFYDGSTSLGTGTLNASGVATYATSALSVATHSITANYPGATSSSINFTASTSAALPVTITAPAVATSTAIAASSTNAVSGTSITFTATVSPASGSTKPSGTVTFYDGATSLGTGTLSGGVASYTTSALSVGTHSITANYPGASGAFTASTSTALSVTITAAVAPDFTISLGATTTTVTHGNPASTTVSITPSGGFTAATSIGCTGAPANSLCSASPNPISPAGLNPATATVTLQTSVTTGSLAIHRQSYSLAALPLGVLTGFALFLVPRKRRPAILIVAISITAALLATSGCGHAAAVQSTATTAPGTYTLTVTGTSGATAHSATWTVVVQ